MSLTFSKWEVLWPEEKREALCSADLVVGVGVTEMSKICHGRASGGLHPNERASPSTQVSRQVIASRIRQNAACWE